eukprot:CAMPEP_0116987574 /NCGR_PEP_ID=MMETSP0467-20121206/63598_1 /TAXON_ID=283647 /ORGANISM="Mesodinium pulex, Strain SPMC105" /LENGTH=37 /DNA_ID= /DNA_START= /DNA_END= /DNA_ORIENTATION=
MAMPHMAPPVATTTCVINSAAFESLSATNGMRLPKAT